MDKIYFLLSDYYATGEGMTKAVLVTRANPKPGDYINSDDYSNLETINTPEERAIKEFEEIFGIFLRRGVEITEYQKVERMLPEMVKNLISQNDGVLKYYQKLYINYS